jgi:hypothetical protein
LPVKKTSITMERLGTDFNATGSVMSKRELEELRRKKGECVRCGQKCFQKKLFKMIPITDHGKVLNGRCLGCNPLPGDGDASGVLPAVSRPATMQDLQRFNRSQNNLVLPPNTANTAIHLDRCWSTNSPPFGWVNTLFHRKAECWSS